jgi:hypothetical protein
MSFKKYFKNIQTHHVVSLIAFGVLAYVLYHYSTSKNTMKDSMKNNMPGNGNTMNSNIINPPLAPGQNTKIDLAGNPNPSSGDILEQDYQPASVNGLTTQTHGLPPSCARQQVVNPSELLPKDENSEWARLNPMGQGDLNDVNMLSAGYHIGINSVSSSLRNANLQIRSEPPNPQHQVSPWNNSTIQPDINRRPLEIGCGSQ